jgi:hypothetical protein
LALLTSAILCDFAQVREGLLFVVGGGITRMARPELPAPLNVMLALVVDVPYDQLNQVHEVVVSIKRTDTAEEVVRLVGGAQIAGDVYPGESLYMPLVFDLRGLAVPAYGSYDVQASVDGGVGTTLTFYMIDKPPRRAKATE